jgi:type II secretory pathway component PulF
MLLAVPGAGAFFRHEAQNEFFWLMGTLLAAGIPVREAIAFAVRHGTNAAFRDELRAVEDAVSRGEPLGEAIERARVLGGAATATVQTAESAGALADAFLALSREAQARRSLAGRGLAGAIWALYFALAVAYVLWAVVGFYSNLFSKLPPL